MGHNWIGLCDIGHRGKQLSDIESGAAQRLGQPQRAESSPLERVDLVKWILVVEISILGTSGDTGQQLAES